MGDRPVHRRSLKTFPCPSKIVTLKKRLCLPKLLGSKTRADLRHLGPHSKILCLACPSGAHLMGRTAGAGHEHIWMPLTGTLLLQ